MSDDADTTMSNSIEALVGAAGMNDRNRGLSTEITAGDRMCSYWSNTRSGSLPDSPMSDGASRSRVAASPRWSSGTGSKLSRSRT